MKQTIGKLSAFFLAGILAVGCNNNDTVTTTDTTTDTTAIAMPAPDANNNMMDTTAVVVPPDNTSASTTPVTVASPNPAKKGKKGKVMITEPAKTTATVSANADNTGTYSNPEVMPQFPGGYSGMQRYFENNLNYPEAATNEGVDGVVNVNFTVDENGKLVSPTVTGNKLGYGLEEEALRVVKNMPAWTAGTVKGKKVKTRFTLPVRFQLE